ncbi:MAG: hypothetical protein ACOC1D_00260 [Prolixibacteraceae bacterium]
MAKLFSSQNSSDSLTDKPEKFELISCPLNGKFCTQIRAKMNQNYADYVDFRSMKNFDQSIQALENAYNQTRKLPESPCSACAAFYRSTITESIEDLHDELKGMAKGIFSTKRFESSREKAEQVLEDFHCGARELKSAV